NADDPEESARHTGTDDGSRASQKRQFCFYGRSGQCDADRQREYHGGVAQGEKESKAQGLLALLQHETHRIVDGGNVVRIEGVTQPKHVSDETKTDQGWVVRCVVQI